MSTTATVSALDIPRTPRARAFEIIEAERAAFLASIREQDAAAWHEPTACPGWTVRDLVAHVIGQYEEQSRPWLMVRRIRRARKRYPALGTLDGHNQCQVDDRRDLPREDLVDQFARESGRGLRALRRLPGPLRRMRISRIFPEDASALPEDSLDYLVRVLAARDVWMHRADLADATGGTFQLGHQVGAEQLRPLLANATTWGDQAYLNHFLPRLLELVAGGAIPDFGYPVLLSSCLAAPWRHGSDQEQRAVDGFVHAWWRETTSTAPSACQPWDLLNLLEFCDQDPHRFLDTWPVDAGPPAARQLADLVDRLLPVIEVGTRFSRTVNEWLLGPFPIDFLLQWRAATGDHDLAHRLGNTIDHLQLCRQAHAS